MRETFLDRFIISDFANCPDENPTSLERKEKHSYLSTKIDMLLTNGGRFLIHSPHFDISEFRREGDVCFPFELSDIKSEKMRRFADGLDVIQLFGNTFSRKVSKYNLVDGFSKE